MWRSRWFQDVLYRTQSWSIFHRWLLLCCSVLRHCFTEPLIFVCWDGIFDSSCFLPRKEEVVECLIRLFIVRNIGVVHSYLLRTSFIICIVPSWFSLMGPGIIWCSLKSPCTTSPCARLRLVCTLVPKTLQRLFFTLRFLLDQLRILPKI